MVNLSDRTEVEELLGRLDQLTTQARGAQPAEQEKFLTQIRPLAQTYYELTGKHYVYSAIKWAEDRKG